MTGEALAETVIRQLFIPRDFALGSCSSFAASGICRETRRSRRSGPRRCSARRSHCGTWRWSPAGASPPSSKISGPPFRRDLWPITGGVLTFRHQLVRDAIYEEIPEAALSIALHRETASLALAAAGAPAGQVDLHLMLGGVAPDPEAAHGC